MDHFSSDEIYDDFSRCDLIGSRDNEEMKPFQVHSTRYELILVRFERATRARAFSDALSFRVRLRVVVVRYLEILKVRDHVDLIRLKCHLEVAGSVGVNDKVTAEVSVALSNVLELLQIVWEVNADVERWHFGLSEIPPESSRD